MMATHTCGMAVATNAEEVMIRALHDIGSIAAAPFDGRNRIVDDGLGDILDHTYDAKTYLGIIRGNAQSALSTAHFLIGAKSSERFGDDSGTRNVPMVYTPLERQLIDVLEDIIELTGVAEGDALDDGTVDDDMDAKAFIPQPYNPFADASALMSLACLGYDEKGGE